MAEELETPKTNRFLQFIGKRANLVGTAAGVVSLITAADVFRGRIPLTADLALAVVFYGVGFALGGGYRKPASLHFDNKSDRVEATTIQHNIDALKAQIKAQNRRMPPEMQTSLNEIFHALEDILPRWSSMNAFSDQKYTVNAIVTEYLPTVLTNYLNMPDSLYYNSSKKQYRVEVQEQLDLLLRAVSDIREGVYKDMGDLIERQTYFLRDKFGSQDSNLKA